MIPTIFKYRGFAKERSGDTTIILNGEKITGRWIYGLTLKETDKHIYIRSTDKKTEGTWVCIKETVSAEIPCYKDADGNQLYIGDVVQFYVEHKPTAYSNYLGPVRHVGIIDYHPLFASFVLSADLDYSFENADTFIRLGNKFELIEDKDYEKR